MPPDDSYGGGAAPNRRPAQLSRGPAAGRARVVLVERHDDRHERLRSGLAAAGVAHLHRCADVAEAERLLERHTRQQHCAVDVVVLSTGSAPAAPPPSWSAHPAWREVEVLVLRDRQDGADSADEHAAMVTERVLSLLAQRRERLRLQRLVDLADSVLLTLAEDGRVRAVNHGGCLLLERDAGELVGRDWFAECVVPAAAERCRAEFHELLAAPAGSLLRGVQPVLTGSGEERSIAWRFCPWSGADGRVQSVLCAGQDVTERNRMRALLGWQSSHDLLTTLYNRAAFEQHLADALASAAEQRRSHALCYVDVDQFKVFNDGCGYEAGDELLRQLGELLPSQLPPDDVVARLGGDQFAVLMLDCDEEQALRATARVQGALETYRFLWRGRAYRLGVSMGVAIVDAATASAAAAMGAAEAACNAAKHGGGGRTRVYQADDVDVLARQGQTQWVLRIKRALEENRFQLWLQPIQRIGKGDGDHYELLLRMIDEDGQVVLPGAFLPAAERFHLSTRIDRWVIRHAFAWLAARGADQQASTLCCINLSGLSMADETFLDYTVRELHRHGIAGDRVCFEITETAAISNLVGATRFIRALRAEGVRFALDDFGSGLSSFAYLKSLPVDFLKIDGVFVKDIADNPIDFAMVKSIHEVAQVMGKETIGEFAESEPVVRRLREIGVHFAQGFAVGKPRRVDLEEDGD